MRNANGWVAPVLTPPGAIEYVEWLMKHMLRTSRTELTIDTGHVLVVHTRFLDEGNTSTCSLRLRIRAK